MFRLYFIRLSAWFIAVGMGVLPTHAALTYSSHVTDRGFSFVVVSGEFEYGDQLGAFTDIVRSSAAEAVVFDSPGGNVAKAMDLGRLIRQFGLNTVEFRGVDCASACSLAFMGGVLRIAEPGTIGVHKSSFNAAHTPDATVAVSAVQQMTADIITYMIEMGIDPALLQLSLKYDSDDMRYLSRSEMAQYNVITESAADDRQDPPTDAKTDALRPPQPDQKTVPAAAAQTIDILAIPEARSGRVRHPKEGAAIKASADVNSADIIYLKNGTPVKILSIDAQWYYVQAGGHKGYMHYAWLLIDQYSGVFSERRYIQIKSFNNLEESEAFVRSAPVPLSAFLSANGWIAITFTDTFERATALQFLKTLKQKRAVPDDSFVTYGNTYVRKVCCD